MIQMNAESVTRFRRGLFAMMVCFALCCNHAEAQTTEPGGLKVFGYFQAALGYQKDVNLKKEINSFTLQQLNLFLQKDLIQNWSAFVNFEFVNSYSSLREWGAFSLEEAWINYRGSKQFKLKLGMLTPTFNNLNEIKNRTPLLPYIIRPVVYESSFSEDTDTDEFVPVQAYVQAYGFIPIRTVKLDYAIYLGNSPNINRDRRYGSTGIDTSRTFLVGGRVGMRNDFFKAGISATFDEYELQTEVAERLELPLEHFESIPRLRRGADFSLTSTKWFFESEYIHVSYDFELPQVDFDKRFFYATLGYHFSERVMAYFSYWDAKENSLPLREQGYQVPTFGATFNIGDMIVWKIQTANAHFDATNPRLDATYNYTYLAVSVRF
ncbi:hypothetical protein HUU05_07345 [candidate division KSB1 bacterium]|nr:hypothetical protein [candidate division KSB1 bacterium]